MSGLMTPTRRTFLRVLGSAVVGATVAPSVAYAIEPATPVGASVWAVTDQSSGAITLEMLERAYRMCVDAGDREPTMGVISQATARHLGLVYDVEVAA